MIWARTFSWVIMFPIFSLFPVDNHQSCNFKFKKVFTVFSRTRHPDPFPERASWNPSEERNLGRWWDGWKQAQQLLCCYVVMLLHRALTSYLGVNGGHFQITGGILVIQVLCVLLLCAWKQRSECFFMCVSVCCGSRNDALFKFIVNMLSRTLNSIICPNMKNDFKLILCPVK